MKIAYLILAHKDPKHLSRLIRALSTPNSHFFIHLDHKSNMDDFKSIEGINVSFTKDRVAVYYDYSLVEATLILFENALHDMRCFDYLVRLHGVDYPIQPAFYIETYFKRNYGKEFIEILPLRSGDPEFPIRRINKLYLREDATKFQKMVNRIRNNLRIKHDRIREFEKFFLKPYWGNALFALTRGACEYIRYYVKSNPKIISYFKHTHAPEEMLFQIILGNSPYLTNAAKCLHYIDWSTQQRHPPELTENHLSIFSSSLAIMNGNWELLFANKFSSQNESVVDKLDQIIREKDEAYKKLNIY